MGNLSGNANVKSAMYETYPNLAKLAKITYFGGKVEKKYGNPLRTQRFGKVFLQLQETL